VLEEEGGSQAFTSLERNEDEAEDEPDRVIAEENKESDSGEESRPE